MRVERPGTNTISRNAKTLKARRLVESSDHTARYSQSILKKALTNGSLVRAPGVT